MFNNLYLMFDWLMICSFGVESDGVDEPILKIEIILLHFGRKGKKIKIKMGKTFMKKMWVHEMKSRKDILAMVKLSNVFLL